MFHFFLPQKSPLFSVITVVKNLSLGAVEQKNLLKVNSSCGKMKTAPFIFLIINRVKHCIL